MVEEEQHFLVDNEDPQPVERVSPLLDPSADSTPTNLVMRLFRLSYYSLPLSLVTLRHLTTPPVELLLLPVRSIQTLEGDLCVAI